MANEFLTRSREQLLGGLYRLGAVVGESESSAVYETEFGEDARPAVVKVSRGDKEDPERVIARWRTAIDLSHPNLIRVYAAGSAVLHDVPVVYVVMERAEESLAGVLAGRALSEAEMREMLAPTLAALKYLHNNGYAHGGLKPANVFAVGDLLKLSSDSATRAGDGGLPAEDMRALGAMIVQALTRKPVNMNGNAGGDAEPYILREASQPFTDIVRNCLNPDPDARWTVEQVEARLNAAIFPPVVAPVRPAPMRLERESGRETEEEEPAPSRKTPRWIFGALAALVLVVFLVSIARRRDLTPIPVAPVPTASQETSEPPPPVAEPRAPEVPAPAANPALPGVTAKTPGRRGEGWWVIVAAYNFREPAEKRVQSMAAKFPKFNLGVYEQHADKTYYLVVIGQNISEDQAEALRKRAVSAGLPRDTYIKRFP